MCFCVSGVWRPAHTPRVLACCEALLLTTESVISSARPQRHSGGRPLVTPSAAWRPECTRCMRCQRAMHCAGARTHSSRKASLEEGDRHEERVREERGEQAVEAQGLGALRFCFVSPIISALF